MKALQYCYHCVGSISHLLPIPYWYAILCLDYLWILYTVSILHVYELSKLLYFTPVRRIHTSNAIGVSCVGCYSSRTFTHMAIIGNKTIHLLSDTYIVRKKRIGCSMKRDITLSVIIHDNKQALYTGTYVFTGHVVCLCF